MNGENNNSRVGEVRPNQLLYSSGVGAVVDLPNLSAMVMGLDDWKDGYAREVREERLRREVQARLGQQVKKMFAPPLGQQDGAYDPTGAEAYIGVPIATFPGWMECPQCHLLARLDSDLFEFKANVYHPDSNRYVHGNCDKSNKPKVLPATFLVACEHGHLDDFPWVFYVHQRRVEGICGAPRLKLIDRGISSGSATDVLIRCEECKAQRPMSEAFGKQGKKWMPDCTGRHPHLRDYEAKECGQQMRSIVLGASNSWFPLVLSALSVPADSSKLKLEQLVEENWSVLEEAESAREIKLMKAGGGDIWQAFIEYNDQQIWEAVAHYREQGPTQTSNGLKTPEWQIFSDPESAPKGLPDFRVRPEPVPSGYGQVFKQIVLVERLREVCAFYGFTRIEAPDDADEEDERFQTMRVRLSRKEPTWVPAAEVRGEGIFIQFDESRLNQWLGTVEAKGQRQQFFNAHVRWREARHLNPERNGATFPGLRFVLLHSFSHALMRQLALECGYGAASLKERIYALPPEADDGPMAGVLIYTAAADSEGTLGGLVNLGEEKRLGRHIRQALEQMRLCSSDPLCAEHADLPDKALHGAACHACLFAPETSCERGNKFLDRSVLISTVQEGALAFFPDPEVEG